MRLGESHTTSRSEERAQRLCVLKGVGAELSSARRQRQERQERRSTRKASHE
jgi:hypothetical protein